LGGLKPSKDWSLDKWLKWQDSLHSQVIDLGLERVSIVFKEIFPNGVPFKVITVAGTNGKGSTIAFIDSIYQQSNLSVGKFTSPHITKYNERFAIDGDLVSDQVICNAFMEIESIRGNISLTYFEFSTLAALVIFSNKNIDIATMEVGLGGRLDSVNVVDPDVSVITNIAIDHVEYLGDTRELIGTEKAGIMRPNVPCICGDSSPPKSISKEAENIGAEITFVTEIYPGEVNLKGDHQRINAALAVKVVETLKAEIPITEKQIDDGVSRAYIDGRFQIIQKNNKNIILDVAHNEAAIKVLANELTKNNEPTVAIFSALKDKSIAAMIDAMRPIVGLWLVVPLNVDRAIPTKDLRSAFSQTDNVTALESMDTAISHAMNSNLYSRIVIFGSFHTVSDALEVLNT
tara:strand:- start:1455 stop:2663 length:1209 start_codon:yes stop_codon:yes gene_type:complete